MGNIRVSHMIDEDLVKLLQDYTKKHFRNRSHGIEEFIKDGLKEWKNKAINLYKIMIDPNKMNVKKGALTVLDINFLNELEGAFNDG